MLGLAPTGLVIAPVGLGLALTGLGLVPIGLGLVPIGLVIASVGLVIAPGGLVVAPVGLGLALETFLLILVIILEKRDGTGVFITRKQPAIRATAFSMLCSFTRNNTMLVVP